MPTAFDIVTVGGGLGGATLARVMATRGTRVLVVERARQFVDRVRGEVLQPWGVAEAGALGIYELLRERCGQEVPWLDMYFAGMHVMRRDLVATTPHAAPWLTFYHPAMQEILIEAAARAGAEIRRGSRVRAVTPGRTPVVAVETEGCIDEVSARLVVGADGRGSRIRKWGGFDVRRDPERLLFGGVLLEGVEVPADTGSIYFHPDLGRVALLFPQRPGRVRAYVGSPRGGDAPGRDAGLTRFVAEAVRIGVAAEVLARARQTGPLASFDPTDSWVEHPYREGIALVGDAAAASDPTWGQGMSLTLRDVRTLTAALLAGDDWDAAAHSYATEHDRYYDTVHRVNGWFTDLLMEVDPAAQARRARALPLIAQDPTRVPDVQFGGPELPADDDTRRRFFAEA